MSGAQNLKHKIGKLLWFDEVLEQLFVKQCYNLVYDL